MYPYRVCGLTITFVLSRTTLTYSFLLLARANEVKQVNLQHEANLFFLARFLGVSASEWISRLMRQELYKCRTAFIHFFEVFVKFSEAFFTEVNKPATWS